MNTGDLIKIILSVLAYVRYIFFLKLCNTFWNGPYFFLKKTETEFFLEP